MATTIDQAASTDLATSVPANALLTELPATIAVGEIVSSDVQSLDVAETSLSTAVAGRDGYTVVSPEEAGQSGLLLHQ